MTAIAPHVSPDAAGPAPPTRRRRFERLFLGLAGVSSVLLAWELVSHLGLVRPILISRPSQVVADGWELIVTGQIWDDIWITFFVWGLGFLLAAIVGVTIGLAAGWFRRVRYVVDPWLNVLDAIPSLALIPIFILWFGIGLNFKVFLVFLSAFFFVAVNTLAGVQATERRYVDVAEGFGASRSLMLRSVTLPGSVPYILTGLRQGAARALVAVIVAEFVSSNVGIGFTIAMSGATLQTGRVMFGILLLAIIGIGIGEILGRAERRFDAWRA